MNASGMVDRRHIRRARHSAAAAFLGFVVAACNQSAPPSPSALTSSAKLAPSLEAESIAPQSSDPTIRSQPSAAPTTAGLPSLLVHGATVMDTGLRPTSPDDIFAGVISAVGGGDSVWLASPLGLVRVDPSSNVVTVVDRDPGANVSTYRDDLWRAGYNTGKVMRYSVATGHRTLEVPQPSPLNLMATSTAIWVSVHDDGKVRRLDPATGSVLTTTVVSTPGCCGPAQFARRGDRLFVTVTKDGTIVELDPSSGKIIGRHKLPQACDGLAQAGGMLWTCWFDPSELESEIAHATQRIDPTSFSATHITVGPHDGIPGDVEGEAWIPVQDRIVHLDRATGLPDRELRLDMPGFMGSNLVEASDSVWLTSRTDPRFVRIGLDAFRGTAP